MIKISWYAVAAVSDKGTNMWTRHQAEKKEETLDSMAEPLVADAMGRITGAAKSPISFLKSIGVLGTGTAADIGQAAYQAEFQHNIDAWAAPWTSFWRNYRSTLEQDFGSYYYENRAGGYIGKQVGGGIGWLIGLWFPPLQPLFTELFGELGHFLGTFISSAWTSDVIHPDIPGSPGDTTPHRSDDPYIPSGHDPSWFDGTLITPTNLNEGVVRNYTPVAGRPSTQSAWELRVARQWHYM